MDLKANVIDSFKQEEAMLRTVPTNSKVFLPRFMIMQEM